MLMLTHFNVNWRKTKNMKSCLALALCFVGHASAAALNVGDRVTINSKPEFYRPSLSDNSYTQDHNKQKSGWASQFFDFETSELLDGVARKGRVVDIVSDARIPSGMNGAAKKTLYQVKPDPIPDLRGDMGCEDIWVTRNALEEEKDRRFYRGQWKTAPAKKPVVSTPKAEVPKVKQAASHGTPNWKELYAAESQVQSKKIEELENKGLLRGSAQPNDWDRYNEMNQAHQTRLSNRNTAASVRCCAGSGRDKRKNMVADIMRQRNDKVRRAPRSPAKKGC